MKTTNEIKDEVAKSNRYESWEDILFFHANKAMGRTEFIALENEAMGVTCWCGLFSRILI